MNKVILLFVTLFAVVVGVAVALFFQPDIASEDDIDQYLEEEQVVEQPDVSAEVIEFESTLFTTSKQHFYLPVPTDLVISQLDAGGVSQVFVENDQGDEFLSIVLAQSTAFEGVPIAFDAWLQEELVLADYISTCDNVLFGEVTGNCYRVTEGGKEFVRYYGTADESTYFIVETILELVEEPRVVFMLDGLEFNPLHIEREAVIIS